MFAIIKIGIIVLFSSAFVLIFMAISNHIVKKRKEDEEKKIKVMAMTDEDYDENVQDEQEKIDPVLNNLSDKKGKKYENFKKVIKVKNYHAYKLIKWGSALITGVLLALGINFIFGLVGYVLVYFLIDSICKSIVEKRITKLEIQLVDGLSLIANALKSGSSFVQAVEVMVQEMKPPIALEFGRFLKETRMGASVEESLDKLAEKVESEELKITTVSINIARQAGGNLSEILFNIADTIRERERLKGKVKALTSQGRLSGIVIGALPILLFFIINFIDPEMMSPLINTFIGQLLLLIVFIMEFIGFIWIMKIVKIDI